VNAVVLAEESPPDLSHILRFLSSGQFVLADLTTKWRPVAFSWKGQVVIPVDMIDYYDASDN
jgi:hypothetical protein